MINNQIKELDDQTAVSILSIIAQSRIRSGDCVTQSDSGIQSALKNAFELPASPDIPTQGELARDALLLLADDPAYNKQLSAMINGPQTKSFGTDPVTIAAVITAAIVVLQTRVKIEKDKDGKWTVLIDRKAASTSLVKTVVEKLVALMT
ncbi:MAG: hypothetical protein GY795_30215 [Desulfobacterales bacterium]|nr:hypothetical protein [Desulfobacterales bacterium]